jgi:deoxyribonuclease-4
MRRNEKSRDTNGVIDVPRFGVAGFPPNFFVSEIKKKRENIFQWLDELDLDWIELQCTRGVKMKAEQAHLYRELADQHGIGISIHGPYFISLASGNSDVVARSRDRILQCFDLATQLQTDRIIFHPGYFPGKTADDRRLAVNRIVHELNSLRHDVPNGVCVYPETAGKNSQIGSLDEIIKICERVDYAKPCIDLAHIHAFEHGSLWNVSDITNVFLQIKSRLGDSYLDSIHVHMYPVDYDSHGEKKHKAFSDSFDSFEQLSVFDDARTVNQYYPRAESFIEAIAQLRLYPVVVCEAYNTQDVGAQLMKKLFFDGVGVL